MHPRIRQHNPRPARILNRKLGLPVLARNAPHRATQVLPVQLLHVLDLERLDVQVVEAEQGDGVVEVEAEGVGGEEVGALLDGVGVGGELGGAQFDRLLGDVHAHLELEVLDERRVDSGPVVLERCHAVRRDADFAFFSRSGRLGGLFGGEEGLRRGGVVVDVHVLCVLLEEGRVGQLCQLVGVEECFVWCGSGGVECFCRLFGKCLWCSLKSRWRWHDD